MKKIKIVICSVLMSLFIVTPVFAGSITGGSYKFSFDFKRRIGLSAVAHCDKSAKISVKLSTWGGEKKLKVQCYKGMGSFPKLEKTQYITKSQKSRSTTFSNISGAHQFYIGKTSSNKTKAVIGSGTLTAH